MLAAESILAALADHRARIRNLGIRRIGVFGSFVRGEEREESDIDILIESSTRIWTSNSSSKISSEEKSTSSTATP